MTYATELLQRSLVSPTGQAVRRRVLRQLLSSLVHEGAVRTGADAAGRTTVAGTDAAGEPVAHRFTARRRVGFDRVTLDEGPVERVHRGGVAEAECATTFLAESAEAITADPALLTRFVRELEETLVKDCLAQQARAEGSLLLAEADYDTLEGAVTDGHRYHPAYKSRIGFDLEDNVAFGPEFARPVRPLWVAVRRDIACVATSAGLDEASYLAEQLGETLPAYRARIAATGADPDDYTLLPVHPWQWREQVAVGFAAQLRRGEVVVLGEDPHAFRAQQSIRTLACEEEPTRPYLKLALSIVNTSTSRVLAPHTVANAPRVSDWLAGVVADDPFLAEDLGLVVLRETMGTVASPPVPGDLTREQTYGTLACVWRDSLHRHTRPGEDAVPFTGLTAREVDGTPLIDPWVREAGIDAWVRRLLEVSAVPLLHLLLRHGIALESHAQNMVLLHRGGVPARVALKDFHDGVRFSRAHLAEPDRCPDLLAPPAHHVNANSFLETDDLDQVADFLLDAFFFVNLGELAIFLDDAYAYDEQGFWSVVREVVSGHRARFPELADRFALFDVAKPTVAVEKLTTRRLLPDTELRMHAVANPLAPRGA
jgi:siderophore synthetase component